MRPPAAIEAAIAAATGAKLRIDSSLAMGGGCINQAYLVEGGGQRFFVKTNRAEFAAMFEAETQGLAELESAQALRVPHAVAAGKSGAEAFLVLEFLELGGRGSPAEMGRRLARQHRKTTERFGWGRDNNHRQHPPGQ